MTEEKKEEKQVEKEAPTEAKEGEKKAEEPTESEDDEDDESMPFPKARVVRIIRNEIGGGKQIRSEVKDAVNIWLGDVLKKISREMSNTQYGSVGIADFQRATKPYDMIEDIIKDEKRLLVSIEKLKADSDHIIREMRRFFSTLKGTELEEE
ncbi:hypothetical protein GF374_02080 [Candidatus Woesearchaeota archaeon]|nr:hypothetical protein [Candidatus Woesearchaeota archaeon]